ncbi:TetR/AcrR family transcriptional regulator [Corticibacter populi]|nr:TetR/AcrR family transcriptional regulator [Corticibacter populi]RZS29935.1 TetR family transcriptional regulator [Corticibacter populi]
MSKVTKMTKMTKVTKARTAKGGVAADDVRPAPTPRLGGRSARVIEHVSQAVLEELRVHGMHALSVPRIAERAQVHSSSIYRRWPTAVQLVAFVAARQAEQLLPVPDTGSLAGDLRAMLVDLRRFLEGPDSAAFVAVAFASGDSAELHALTRLYWLKRVALREAMFGRARVRGELDAQTDAEELIERAIGPLYMRRFISHRPIDDAFIERVVQGVLPERMPGSAGA